MASPAEPQPTSAPGDPARTGRRGSTVLLVEDNADNRFIYAAFLRHVGHVVVEATDGVEAIDQARATLPDLILMDISLPRLDGYEAARRIRTDPLTAHVPIVALTAYVGSAEERASLEAGCDRLLFKPIEPRLVLAEVQRFLGPVPAPPSPSAVPVKPPSCP